MLFISLDKLNNPVSKPMKQQPVGVPQQSSSTFGPAWEYSARVNNSEVTTGWLSGRAMGSQPWEHWLESKPRRAPVGVWAPHTNTTSKQKQASQRVGALLLARSWCSMINRKWCLKKLQSDPTASPYEGAIGEKQKKHFCQNWSSMLNGNRCTILNGNWCSKLNDNWCSMLNGNRCSMLNGNWWITKYPTLQLHHNEGKIRWKALFTYGVYLIESFPVDCRCVNIRRRLSRSL